MNSCRMTSRLFRNGWDRSIHFPLVEQSVQMVELQPKAWQVSHSVQTVVEVIGLALERAYLHLASQANRPLVILSFWAQYRLPLNQLVLATDRYVSSRATFQLTLGT